MPRSKSVRNKILQQLTKAVTAQRKVLEHMAYADCLSKGGSVTNGKMYMPEGVNPANIADEGHPQLNAAMAGIVTIGTTNLELLEQLKSSI